MLLLLGSANLLLQLLLSICFENIKISSPLVQPHGWKALQSLLVSNEGEAHLLPPSSCYTKWRGNPLREGDRLMISSTEAG